ncbi:hypothetical protein BD560DRAFT_484076 [Blakeslea trispora]|nr:hypothetical protein BD560DRAFT_484076 [Blakeslea trispora]
MATVSAKPTMKRGRVASSKRTSSRSIDPDIVYDYTLRCAIRAYLEQSDKKFDSNDISPTNSVKKKEPSRQLSNLAEKFSDNSDKKNDKLNREIVKGLMRRLEDVYKGKDTALPEYTDERFRSAAKQLKKHLDGQRYRPTGSIIDTVILFLKTSEAELKADQPNPAIWYEDLNRFVTGYVELVISTVQEDSPSSATPELMKSLAGFCTTPNKRHSQKKPVTYQHVANTPPPTAESNSNADKRISLSSTISNISQIEHMEEFPMIATIKQLFNKDHDTHRKKLQELSSICTESALLNDFKKCINNVHTNQPFPGRRDDFPTTQAYENWQKKEVKQLQELMKSLMLMNPNLSIATSNETDSAVTESGGFAFIPNDPKNCYKYLMTICLDTDIENFSSVPESERSKTSVLSHQSDEILRECWKTWRLSAPYRAVVYLSLVKSKYDQDQLNVEDINDALRSLDKVTKEHDFGSWATADRDNAMRTLKSLDSTFLKELASGLSEYWKISPGWIQEIIESIERIQNNPIYKEFHSDVTAQLNELEEKLEGAAVERWSQIEKLTNKSDEKPLNNLFSMAEKLFKEFTSIAKKKFPQPIMGVLSVPSIVMARQMPYFALEMENWAYSPDFKSCPIDSAFELYEKVLYLEKLYDQYGPKTKKSLFKVESWFLPHVKRWLSKTNESTIEWVNNAIAQDQFQCFSESVEHSSSIIDLFSMFSQAVEFINNLQWPNDLQHCLFETYLAKIIGEGIEHYCFTLEDLIRKDIYTKRALAGSTQNTNESILDRARFQILGQRAASREEGYIPPNFITPELCIKLNNMEAARGKLDRLYQSMHVDDVAQYMRENDSSQQQQQKLTKNNNILYTIRVVRAENLRPMDNNGLCDPYVTFEIDNKFITRTRTVYETLNPRWDEEFDIWLSDDNAVDVCVIVNDEDLITADEECGVAWFILSPKHQDIYQRDDIVLNLSPQGTLVLRVNMESEKNDIQFWFGKAFRTLKTSEKDAAGLITDKMGPYLHYCLSREIIDRILGKDKVGFFSSFSRAVISKLTEPDLQACEDAIAPLLDFLEHNLRILNENLSETNMQFVVLRIWDQILKTLECVLLPPLSEHLSEVKPLDDYELNIVLKWLELLKIFFNGGEDGDAIPLEVLENAQYFSLLSVNAAYHLDAQVLMDGYHQVGQRATLNTQMLNKKKTNRAKSVYHSKNTIRQKKREEKKKEERKSGIDLPHGDAILRLLRMRQDKNVAEFLKKAFEKRNLGSLSPKNVVDELDIKEPPLIAEIAEEQEAIAEEVESSQKEQQGVTLTD